MSLEWNGVPKPTWAEGCEHCKFGIQAAPPISGTDVPFFWQRAIAMRLGLVLFCECRAGQAQQKYLESVLAQIPDNIKITRRSSDNLPAWVDEAPADYIPGSWWQHVQDAAAQDAPTIHLVQEAAS